MRKDKSQTDTGKPVKEKELIVVGDTHVARVWDKIEPVISGHAHYLNPNQALRDLAYRVNQMPDVGAVIFPGDEIDYHYQDYPGFFRSSGKRLSNWKIFNDIMRGLNVPVFQIPGNHEYRKEPYNFSIYGLRHVNVPDSVRRELGREIGHKRFRGLGELESVFNGLGFNGLIGYNGERCPSQKQIGRYNCVFLDTGGDAFRYPRNWAKYFMKAGRMGFSVDSDGLQDEDVEFVKDASRDVSDTLLVFMHSPLVHSEEKILGREYELPLDEDGFLSSVISQGLGHRIALNNGGNLLATLASTDGNHVIVSGHVHDQGYMLFDKDGYKRKKVLRAREVDKDEFNDSLDNPRFVKHATTRGLGAIEPDLDRRTGYTKITPDGFEEVIVGDYR